MTRTATEWSPDDVRRFWEHESQRPGFESTYFSLQVGDAIIALLELTGSLRAGTRVLDYGCGPGHLAEKLIAAGYACAGVDSSTRAVAAANARLSDRSRWLGAVDIAGVHALPTPFDLVTCLETVEHLSNEELSETLSVIRGHLRTGGVAFFTTPNDEHLSDGLVYCPFCDTEFHRMQHVRAFDRADLTKTLSRHGFHVERCFSVDLEFLNEVVAGATIRWARLRSVAHAIKYRRRWRWGGLHGCIHDGPTLVALATNPTGPDDSHLVRTVNGPG